MPAGKQIEAGPLPEGLLRLYQRAIDLGLECEQGDVPTGAQAGAGSNDGHCALERGATDTNTATSVSVAADDRE